MVKETGEEWPSKLQAAVLAANTCWKRSTDFSPFYLMYGRDANCAHLLEHNNLAMLDEDKEELEDLQHQTPEEVDTFSPEPEHLEESKEPLLEARSQSQMQARDNTSKEQQLQKLIFDNKVKKNR